VAVFQDSTEPYLPLALKYRQNTRSIAQRIPLDILPLKSWTSDDPFLAEVAKGEVAYERGNRQMAPLKWPADMVGTRSAQALFLGPRGPDPLGQMRLFLDEVASKT
jgi:hypothetical protein